ncbi:hypothetical protein BDW60DRAFT_210170 [Aspergillus nidulans var. acristatus]
MIQAGKPIAFIIAEGDAYVSGLGDGLPASQAYKTYAKHMPVTVTVTVGSLTDASTTPGTTSTAEATSNATQAFATTSKRAKETTEWTKAEETLTRAAARSAGSRGSC